MYLSIMKNPFEFQPDNVSVALMPLSLLNAEPMPDWFLVSTKRSKLTLSRNWTNKLNKFQKINMQQTRDSQDGSKLGR